MSEGGFRKPGGTPRVSRDPGTSASSTPGKVARTDQMVQRKASGEGELVADVAARGVAGPSAPLPHREAIQRSFGRHDVANIEAHVGGVAADASNAMGAEAYATGQQVAFRDAPDLHTAAHEAAHVVQQRAGLRVPGGVGQEGDEHEQHADQVADAVVAGRSAEGLLDERAPAGGGDDAPVQRKITVTGVGEFSESEPLWVQHVRPYLVKHNFGVRGRRRAIDDLVAGPDQTFGTVAEVVDTLRGAAPIKRELGRGRPEWDDRWANLHAGWGNDRRHVVISSLMRDTLYHVTDTNKPDDAIAAYTKLLGKNGKLEDLEKALAVNLHNNKFNIFFGKSSDNQMLGGIAHALPKVVPACQQAIAKAYGCLTDDDLAAQQFAPLATTMMRYVEVISTAPVFGYVGPRQRFVSVVAHRVKVICDEAAAKRAQDPCLALKELCDAFSEIILDTAKTANDDISQAVDEDYRKLQNAHLLEFHDHFTRVMSMGGPDALRAFVQVYQKFMALEEFANAKLHLAPAIKPEKQAKVPDAEMFDPASAQASIDELAKGPAPSSAKKAKTGNDNNAMDTSGPGGAAAKH